MIEQGGTVIDTWNLYIVIPCPGDMKYYNLRKFLTALIGSSTVL